MAQVIPNGGTRESQDKYVGAARELTVDTSNQELRLHDGATPGGHRIPNIDTLDDSYQKRNADLDGLSFRPAARGFLVRLSAGVYAIRKFIGADGAQVENPDGYDGDITIRLGSEIDQDMTFKGDVLFKKVVEVEGGLNGNTSGMHTGGLDARGATVQFDNRSIPASAIDTGPAAASEFKAGMIVIWAGALTSIPTGWALCNGDGGTPNLSERFVIGVSPTVPQGSTGGRVAHNHLVTIQPGGEHSHAGDVLDFTLEEIHMPRHRHTSGVCDQDGNAPFNHGMVGANPQAPESINATSQQPGRFEALTDFAGGGQPHDHGLTIAADGNHTHGASMEDASHIPPYYALAYIMRMA